MPAAVAEKHDVEHAERRLAPRGDHHRIAAVAQQGAHAEAVDAEPHLGTLAEQPFDLGEEEVIAQPHRRRYRKRS